MKHTDFNIAKSYHDIIKNEINNSSQKYIDDLFNKSNYDKATLETLTDNIKAYNAQIKANTKWWASKIMIIIMCLLLFISIIGSVVCFVGDFEISNFIKFIPIVIGVIILCLLIPQIIFFQKYKKANNELQNKIAFAKDDARKILYPVIKDINIFTFLNLIHDAFKDVEFYPYLDNNFASWFKSDLIDHNDISNTLSGHINGIIGSHPFVLKSNRYMHMENVPYYGSRMITIDNEVYTLTATYYHPKPFYSNKVYLSLYTEAFNQLSFNNIPSFKNDKQVNKFYEKTPKYRKMENPEFDRLLPCYRNDEILFRSFFSIYSQELMVDFFNQFNPKDLSIFKNKGNTVNVYNNLSLANQKIDIGTTYLNLFDIENIKSTFVSLTNELGLLIIQNLSAILNSVAIQEETIVGIKKPINQLNSIHIESILNGYIDISSYLHPNTAKSVYDGIIKIKELSKTSDAILARMTVHSYSSKTLIASVYASNGKASGYVDVPYEDFSPISKSYLVLNFISNDKFKNFTINDQLKQNNVIGLFRNINHYAVIFTDNNDDKITLSVKELINIFK